MKRLNFGQVKAEKSSMQRADPFFTLILFLFSTLVISFFAFDFHLSGLDVEKQKVTSLSHRLLEQQIINEALKLEVNSLAHNTAPVGIRNIASLTNVDAKKEISLDRLYRAQLERALQLTRSEEILSLTKKILNSSADQDLLAQALFARSHLSCDLVYKENECFADVENLIQQFPESRWAGESLVKLSQMYLKQKKYKEAESVIKIVKVEFSKDLELIKRIHRVEKQKL